MRVFEEKYDPIEYTIKNKEGQAFVIQSRQFTLGDLEEIEQMTKQLNDQKIDNTEYLWKTLQKVFGKDEKFWKQFSMRLINELTEIAIKEVVKKNNQKTTDG
jgi:hypothetical protein